MLNALAVFLLLASLCCLGQVGQVAKGAATPHKLICTTVPAGKIVKRVWPILPPEVAPKVIAEGVVVKLTIDKEGVPRDIQVTKGDPLLAKAAVEALRQWRWKPYKLNGEAVEVESSIFIRFEPSTD